jgi:hypothetical protein
LPSCRVTGSHKRPIRAGWHMRRLKDDETENS